MSCGCDCGSILVRPAAAPVSPLEIVAADDIIAGWDAAVRVDTAGAVSVLPDVSGNGFNLTQAVEANQPTAVVGGGPNGNDSILFDGVNDIMSVALNLPAPGTTPTFFWSIIRHVTWISASKFWNSDAGGGSRMSVFDNSATPQIAQADNAIVNSHSGLTLNVYKRLEVLFSASASDYIKAGAAAATTGASAGNIDPAGPFTLGGFAAGTNNSNIEVCELWLFRIALTLQQKSQLNAYASNRYGIGVVS